MRKASRLLAVLMAALLLFSVAAVGISADRHSAPPSTPPTKTIPKMTKAPTIDGKIDGTKEWGSPLVSFSDKNFDEKTGGLWSDKNIDGLTFKPMAPAEVNAYMAWDETTFYFALTTKQAKHTNTEHNKLDLWKGDCLQIQISNKEGGTRYEMGFAYSTFGPKNRLAYQWFPLPAKELPNGKKNGYFYADRNESTKTTTYELALKADMFGGSKLTANSKIPFSFALHLFEESTDPLAESSGCFYEWASGVVGGDLEKDIKQAAVLTLGTNTVGGGGSEQTQPPKTNPPATQPPKTQPPKTNPPVNPGKTDPTKTPTQAPNNNQQTQAPNNDKTTVNNNVDTTEAPTTTLPDLTIDQEKLVLKDLTEVTDEAIVSALAKASEMDSVKVQSGNPDGKFMVVADDFLTVYYLDGEEYKTMDPDTESVEGMFVYDNEVGAETVYLVLPADPTTVPPVETTAAADGDTVTTKKVTTTAAGSTDDGNSEGGFPTWAIILIVVVVVAGAGAAAFFIIKKKKDGGLQ